MSVGLLKKPRERPEHAIQLALIDYLQSDSWLVEVTHGNAYQTGFPDLYCFHRKWGERWIDVKNPGRYSFTREQKRKWPIWDAAGVGIWILTAANQVEYAKLFKPPNWRSYWKPSWGKPVNRRDASELVGRITL